jgi:isopenicillin-N epimerase
MTVSHTATNAWTRFWSLDPEITYLNHGSFGACPLPVLERQRELRSQVESNPTKFFEEDYEPLLDAARARLAEFIGADADDLAFVQNATTGVNTVLRSLDLKPGDELLTTDHEYNACRNALDFVAERSGARVVVANVTLPVQSPEQIVDAVIACVTSRTRLVLIDHVTSKTAIVQPVESLVAKLNDLGVDVLVDGAHAPGMDDVDIKSYGPANYAGNCHKWLSAPRGAGFLFVRRDKQQSVRPLSISHGTNSTRTDRSRFILEFNWTGTQDLSAYLSVPNALDFLGGLLPGGWDELRRRNHALVIEARHLVCGALGTVAACPESMTGSMVSIHLPNGLPNELSHILRHQWHIDVPIHDSPDGQGRYIRLSAQIYNTLDDYAKLTHALTSMMSIST